MTNNGNTKRMRSHNHTVLYLAKRRHNRFLAAVVVEVEGLQLGCAEAPFSPV